jgi:hypothetical protein
MRFMVVLAIEKYLCLFINKINILNYIDKCPQWRYAFVRGKKTTQVQRCGEEGNLQLGIGSQNRKTDRMLLPLRGRRAGGRAGGRTQRRDSTKTVVASSHMSYPAASTDTLPSPIRRFSLFLFFSNPYSAQNISKFI